MTLKKIREEYVQRVKEYEDNLKSMTENEVKHFRSEGDGPLSDITEQIRNEYHRHIETYAALIAQIDAILGA
ncbi:hypothetical protein [Rhizobium mesoamericanum]|uniref:Uncharacterized protein n=1 Tax=Rhizobium mesoamericanum STM3625 TaxID=1211777 RepID=K0PTQ2_9HYPH|nr:hypothetical protein [Rhizobium mesoamericanum]MDQ0559444.1 hypothetical protein [Rhizobium mesoamericanum]CCM74735.1 hypothetical protein BN77_1875 [Rhizobium mesoamericanum STM3625]